MIKSQHFVNKLRELGFKFKRQAPRIQLYRQKGTGKRVEVPRSDYMPEEHVRQQLKQIGCSDSEIRQFIADAKS